MDLNQVTIPSVNVSVSVSSVAIAASSVVNVIELAVGSIEGPVPSVIVIV